MLADLADLIKAVPWWVWLILLGGIGTAACCAALTVAAGGRGRNELEDRYLGDQRGNQGSGERWRP